MSKIAVLGYGTVGSGVVAVFNTNRELINTREGEEIEVKYVLDLRDFPGDPVEKVLVHDVDIILNDPEVKIIAEVMGGMEPAFTFTKRALSAGKSVCTSNKELVAAHTVMNKVTGIVLFILPLTITRIDLKYSGALVSAVATFAAIQEGHYIRTGIIVVHRKQRRDSRAE